MPLDQNDEPAYMKFMEFVFSLKVPGGYPAEGLDPSIVRELLEETGLSTKTAEIEPTKE